MKNFVIISLLVLVAAAVAFAARNQSRSKSTEPVRPTVRVTKTTPPKSSLFMSAATENAALRNELTWTFGGKQQRGWYLYDSLIGKTLNTHHESTTSDFAAALAAWQKKMRLSADGVLDENSLMRMISQWQSNRLKNRTYATPDQLLTAPPADFYDPGRAAELRQVERNTYEAYKEMIAAARDDRTL